MRISQILDLFAIAVLNFIFALFLSFSRPPYSRYLLRVIFFLAAVKRFGVNYGQSLEIEP